MISLNDKMKVFREWNSFQRKYGFPEIKYFWDGILSIATNQFIIDINKFDDWLRERFGNYDENDDKSMKDLLGEKFGQDVVDFFEKLFKKFDNIETFSYICAV